MLEERVWNGLTVDEPAKRPIDRRYVWGPRGMDDLILRDAQEPGSSTGPLDQRLWSVADANGSVLSLFNAKFGLVEPIAGRFAYDAYGTPSFLSSNFGPADPLTLGWNILFGGYYYDHESGLYHVRNRVYDPNLGRFLQTDPRGFQDSYNLYQYALSAPLSYTDPTGEAIPLLVWAGLAIMAGGVGAAHFGAHRMEMGVDA